MLPPDKETKRLLDTKAELNADEIKEFRFEIQACIDVKVLGISKEQARVDLIDNLSSYADELIKNPYVSDGLDIKKV